MISRHIRWGLIFGMAVLIAIAASAPYWLDLLKPLRVEDVAEEVFPCPESFAPEVCADLEAIHEENPAEALAMIDALQTDPVPAPSNESSPDSVEEDIDREALSVFTNILIRTGQFTALDRLHRAEGAVNVYELNADGNITRVLRFEQGFQVSLGPDLRVFLSINPEPMTADEVLAGESAVQIGILKGHVGAQNYTLAPEVDITQFASIVIYSPQLERVFSYAALQQPIQ